MVSVFVAAFVVVQDQHHIHFRSAKWLIIFAVLGIPLGVWLLVSADERLVKFVLGILIILYSIYALFAKSGFKLPKDSWLWLFVFGFISGVLGGAYGVNGPPLVIYGNARGWTAKHFRATLQAYFLPVSVIGLIGYWIMDLWHSSIIYYFLMGLPVIIPAILLGRYFNHRLRDNTFLKFIFVALIGIGIILIIQSI